MILESLWACIIALKAGRSEIDQVYPLRHFVTEILVEQIVIDSDKTLNASCLSLSASLAFHHDYL